MSKKIFCQCNPKGQSPSLLHNSGLRPIKNLLESLGNNDNIIEIKWDWLLIGIKVKDKKDGNERYLLDYVIELKVRGILCSM